MCIVYVAVCAHLPKAYRLLFLGLECRCNLLWPVEEGSGVVVVVVVVSPRNASTFGLV